MTDSRTAGAMSVDQILVLFERHGADHYDEVVSQLDHALQTAAQAVAAEASDHLVAAALLHDVGHLLELEAGGSVSDADLRHESVGARYLSALYPTAVTAPVALHVRAKRYLCAVEPGYRSTLSDGSIASLERQGGPLDRDEAARFEHQPGATAAVDLRRWDDGGKVEGLDVPGLDHYRDLLERARR